MKNKNQTKENWEKEFEEKFAINIGRNWFFTEDEAKELKSFIRQLLKSEKDRWRRRDISLCSADILRAQEIERNKCKSEKEKLLERIRLKKWERTKRRDVIATEMDRIMCETRNNTIKELEKLKESIKKEL